MKDFLRRSIGIFLGDYGSRTLLVSAGSSILNALIGAAKLVLGIVFFSPWLIVTGIYYLVLCAARGRILKIYGGICRMNEEADREARQTALFRHSGFFICMIGLSYLGVCLCMYFWGEVVTYPPYLIYGVAAVAFYKIGMAIRGMIVTRKMHNPLLSTLKIISFIDACVSIMMVQCALLAMKGSPEASSSSALLGMACSGLFLGIGLYMVCSRKDRKAPPAANTPYFL